MNIEYSNKDGCFLIIDFPKRGDFIPLLVNYVKHFLVINLVNKKTIENIAVSFEELADNAIKYSSSGLITLLLFKKLEENKLELIIRNPAGNEDFVKSLDRVVSEINKDDSFHYYFQKKRKQDNELGLAQINYETGAKLTTSYNDADKKVEVKAEFELY